MIKKLLITAASIIILSGCSTNKKCNLDTDMLDEVNNQLEAHSADKVYFGFDKTAFTQKDMETLSRQAQWLRTNPKYDATVEGHCDARGTVEYNLALGERRAHEVKKYLVEVEKIDASRISTISYGKERPAVIGNAEEDFALNRRAVTIVTKK